ncbi:flavin reductase family protein [Streptomyces sp. NPDC048594]
MTTGATALEARDRAVLDFREAMASFPSGVTIVTTTDAEGKWWGFTATSFCSLSVSPPLVLVCLAKNARCHPAFLAARSWAIHVLPEDRTDLAMVFASRDADKFAAADFTVGQGGNPVLADASVVLECAAAARYDGGDHTILVGRVEDVGIRESEPAVYFKREFHRIANPGGK